jgi:hypothetical protein
MQYALHGSQVIDYARLSVFGICARSIEPWWEIIRTEYIIIITILDIINKSVFNLEHNISDTGFCFRPQVEHTLLGPVDSLCIRATVSSEGRDRIQSQKRCAWNKRQDDVQNAAALLKNICKLLLQIFCMCITASVV